MAVIAKTFGQPSLELIAALLHPVEQVLVGNDPLYLERRRAGERVREIGVAVLERARAVADGVDDGGTRQHRADRLIAATQTLGDGLDVRGDALLLPGVQGTCA